MWFADSEDISVTSSVERLGNTSGLDNHVISQVGILVRELCKAQGLPEPAADLEQLVTAMTSFKSSDSSSTSSSSKSASSSTTTDNGSTEDMDIEYEFDDDEQDDDDDGKRKKMSAISFNEMLKLFSSKYRYRR